MDLAMRIERLKIAQPSVPGTARAEKGHIGSRRAVFIDRDGVLNEDTIHTYDPDELRIIEGSRRAVDRIRDMGFLRIVVSNQAGIAKALFTLSDMVTFDERLWDGIGGRPWDALYFCPYHIEGVVPEYSMHSVDRKPEPGMILRASLEHDIDLARSYMVGDHLKDVVAAHRAGCRGILVTTGRGKREMERLMEGGPGLEEALPDAIVQDLDFASMLIQEWER
jgi:D-glycero-D-manno-heptose 1,7-bisphosphate phosphatase